MHHIFKSQQTFEHATALFSIEFNIFILVTTASSHDITAINVLMNSLVSMCKWSIVMSYYSKMVGVIVRIGEGSVKSADTTSVHHSM